MARWTPWVLAVSGLVAGAFACKGPKEPGAAVPAAVRAEVGPDAHAEAKQIALTAPPGSGGIDQEILHWQLAAKRLPGKVEPWIALGQAWVKKARQEADPGFYVNANACADVAEAVDPGGRLGRDLRALALLNDHRFEEARALEQAVLAEDPDDAQALGSLSDALLELGRFEEASRAAQAMMDLKPNLPSYSRASYFRWLQGDDLNAKRFVREAIDSGATTGDGEPRAWTLVQAAQIFWHEGDYEGAEAGFDQALAQRPGYAPALAGKGRVAIARGDSARAAAYLAESYAASPLVETAWLLGDARTMAGDASGAAEAYARVEARGRGADPRTLSLFWSTKGTHAAEALALAQAETQVRSDLYTDDALAWALYRAGRFAEARTAIDRATHLGTRDARLVYHAGAIRLAQGDVHGKQLVARALAMNAAFDFTGGAEARALLSREGR